MNGTMADQHLSDGEVYRVVDDQLDASEQERVRAHLAGCESCRAAVDRAQLRTQRLSELLVRTDFPLPPLSAPQPAQVIDLAAVRARRTSVPGWLRAAAIIVLLISGMLAIPPVRAAIVQWVQSVWSSISNDPPGAPAPTQSEAQQAVPEGGPRVQFTTTSSVLYLEFGVGSGVVRLQRNPEAAVVAEADRGSIDFVVLPNRLRVINARQPSARYTVAVPEGVTTIVVLVGGREQRRVRGEQLQDAVELELR